MRYEVVIIILQQLPPPQQQLPTTQLTCKMLYHLRLLLLVFMHSITHKELKRRKILIVICNKKCKKLSTKATVKRFNKKECATRQFATSNKQKEPDIMSCLKNHLSFANKDDATVTDRWAYAYKCYWSSKTKHWIN